ncbi:MAG: Tol-Pal system protein TolB, partial [Hyphomonas sp.]
MTRLLLTLVMTFFVSLGFASSAHAELKVLVEGGGNFKPTPLAIPDFQVRGTNTELARQIADVVRSDLESTGLFEMQNPASFIQKDLS